MTRSVDGVVRRHLDSLHLRGLRQQSIYNRSRALERLSKHLGGPILYATADDLHGWQADRAKVLSAASRAAELSNVREFYRWAIRDGFRDEDPTTRLHMPRVPRRMPRPLADKALAGALANARPDIAAILGLGAFAGLRACEIAWLDWSEVSLDEDPPMLRVADGKGGHGRMVPVSPALSELLDRLPTRRGSVISRPDGAAGGCLPHNISSRANNYLHSIGVADTLHQTRHRFATAAYRACQDLRAVQVLLGHASPVTTSLYAAHSTTATVDAVLKAGLVDGAAPRKAVVGGAA